MKQANSPETTLKDLTNVTSAVLDVVHQYFGSAVMLVCLFDSDGFRSRWEQIDIDVAF